MTQFDQIHPDTTQSSVTHFFHQGQEVFAFPQVPKPLGNQAVATAASSDLLSIKFSGQDHLVDTIVRFKRTKMGKPLFRLSMYCPCCKSKQYWFCLSQIEESGTKKLVELALQVQEFYLEGIDI